MLVLTRKSGQKLMIGDNIEVTILETKGDSVKIGIQAPRDVSVYREEIYTEIRKANQQAVQAPSDLGSIMGLIDSKTDSPSPSPPPAAS